MADITMCESKTCPRRSECYRYQAIPEQMQSYCNFGDICSNDDFSYFVEIPSRKSVMSVTLGNDLLSEYFAAILYEEQVPTVSYLDSVGFNEERLEEYCKKREERRKKKLKEEEQCTSKET